MRPGYALVFVFNCDRGSLSAIKDYAQKRAGDKPPGCPLFDLISTPVGMKKGWKRYIQGLPLSSRFLHHDEYEEEFGALLTALPAVFLHHDRTKSILISADELYHVVTLDDLIVLVDKKLNDRFLRPGR